MREIKFRAWDKIDGFMYFPTDIKLANEGITWIWDRVIYNKDGSLKEDDSVFRNIEHIEVMQFTGLKDKNGIDIYEGDILQSFPTQDVIFLVGFGDNTDDNSWGFNLKSNRTKGTFNFDKSIQKMEVIGNKFENPELLK